MVIKDTYGFYDKALSLAISLFILIVSLVYLPHIEGIRENRVVVLAISIIAACALITIRKNPFISLLMMYTAIHIYCVSWTYNAVGASYQIAAFSVCYAVISMTNAKWERYKITVYNAICIIALVNVYAEWLQFWDIYIFPKMPAGFTAERSFGLTGNPNEVSALLAISLPFFFRKRWAWCIPAIVGGLVMARTTNGLLASLLVTGVYLAYRYRKEYWMMTTIALSLFVCAGVYITTIDKINVADQMGGRGLVYKRTIQLANSHPTGWGFAQFESIMPMVSHTAYMSDIAKSILHLQLTRKDLLDGALENITKTKDVEKMRVFLEKKENNTTAGFLQAHNEYLEWLFIAGYAGLILMVLGIVSVLWKGFKQSDKMPALCFVASLSCALFFFPWQIIPTALLTVVGVAIIAGESIRG